MTRGTGIIALSVGLMNVTTYAFTMLAARILGPAAYGAMAGLMATVLVIGVIQLGVQATAARRVAADPGQHVEIEHRVVAVTTWMALALGGDRAAREPAGDGAAQARRTSARRSWSRSRPSR